MQSLIPMLMMSVCSNYFGENSTKAPSNDEDEEVVDPGCVLRNPPLLTHVHLRIATISDHPLSYVVEEGGRKVGKGVVFDFVEILRSKFGFTYEVLTPRENVIGDNNTGLLSMLNKGEADMAAYFLPIIYEKNHGVRYSFSLGDVDWVVMMKRPRESANGSGLFAPFDTTVWLLILVSLVLTGPVIYLIILVRVKLCKGSERLTRIYPLDACVWFVYGALMKQGSTLSPMTDSSRLLFATWWIFITILTSFYTANLTAFLTLSRFTLPIDDARDMAVYRYRWMAQKGLTMHEVVRHDPAYDYLNHSVKAGRGEFLKGDNLKMMSIVQKENKMYLRERNVVEYLILRDYVTKTHNNVEETERCTFVSTPKAFMERSVAFAYQPGTNLHKLFDPVFMGLVEQGIVKHLLRKDLPKNEVCPLNLGSKERQLRNSDLFMTYIIVMSGYAIAVAIFCGELLARVIAKFHESRVIETHDTGYVPSKSHMFPPPYSTVLMGLDAEGGIPGGKKQNINGRDYLVVDAKDGDRRLIPMRTPSAFLFQYSA
ncbi:glutamate receptor ionotropic, delta-1 [Bacillus rossius redtenbacheri]|uniref:glutamate receptor ionotropic, delta-1 n=1 Tax=Bacillus rossius redtenbacheri TaxID=93214 RepID=UPI002FDE6907